MKFQIKVETIKKILKKLSYLTPSISHRPELTGVVIDVYDTRVVFEVRNEYLDAKVEVYDLNEISIQEKGRALVKAKVINEIIQMMNGNFIEFIKVEDSLLTIKSSDSQYEINLMNVERVEKTDFTIPLENTEEIKISSSKLKSLINKVIFSGNEMNSRRILQGINFLLKENSIIAIATDGVRIAIKVEDMNFNGKTQKIIPIKTLKEISKVIDDIDEVILNFIHNKLILVADEFTIQTKLIEGTFPDIVPLFPKEFSNNLLIKKNELIDLINRATLLSSNKIADNIYVKIIIIDSLLKFEAREIEIGYANVSTTNYQWEGELMYQIAFNPRFLIEALKSIEEERVQLFFNDNQSPFVVKGEKDKTFKALILPFRT